MPYKRQHELDAVLIGLSQMKEIDEGNQELVFQIFTEQMAQHLHAERVSIWLYDEQRTGILCHDLFDSRTRTHEKGQFLKAADSVNYFEALTSGEIICCPNVYEAPETQDLIECYLRPNGIASIMDAPIRVKGRMCGVICAEKITGSFECSYLEQRFVGNLSFIVARAILAQEKAEVLLRLEEANTALRLQTRQLEEEKLKVDHAHKMASLGEMASGIAHEINNPLTIIKANSDYVLGLIETNSTDREDICGSLKKIQLTSLRIEKIIKGLKFFARDGRSDDENVVSIQAILEDTLALCEEKFKVNGHKIIVDCPREDILISCQTVSISQALLNLLNNAYDVIRELPEGWVRIKCQTQNDRLVLTLTDSGSGIPVELREKIMQPFFSTKPVGKGTGLGLAIVRGIIDQHHGHFYLDETSPHTSFVIELPLAG